jgi:four helix bundle protein
MGISKFENGPERLMAQNDGKTGKKYDLEERTALFAEGVRDFCLRLPRNAANSEYIPQLIRAGSSPGANYIEANETIGDKDFKMKIKTCRREAKESSYWLRLVITDGSKEREDERAHLRQEAKEFVLIFSAILKKRDTNSIE